jgi:hypothetical protein
LKFDHSESGQGLLHGIRASPGSMPASLAALRPSSLRVRNRLWTVALEEQRRFIRVVRLASQLDIRRRRLAARGIRPHVVILEERVLGAAAAASDEGAVTLVSLPNFAPYRGGNLS